MYTWSNGPFCTSLSVLLCTNIKIDDAYQKGTSCPDGLWEGIKAAWMPIFWATWPKRKLACLPVWNMHSTNRMTMHLSSPSSTVNPASLLQSFDFRARPENNKWQPGDSNIFALAIIFPPKADLPRELRTHLTAPRITLVTHISITHRRILNLGPLWTSFQSNKVYPKERQCSQISGSYISEFFFKHSLLSLIIKVVYIHCKTKTKT